MTGRRLLQPGAAGEQGGLVRLRKARQGVGMMREIAVQQDRMPRAIGATRPVSMASWLVAPNARTLEACGSDLATS